MPKAQSAKQVIQDSVLPSIPNGVVPKQGIITVVVPLKPGPGLAYPPYYRPNLYATRAEVAALRGETSNFLVIISLRVSPKGVIEIIPPSKEEVTWDACLLTQPE